MERLTRWAPLALGILRIVAALLFIEHGTQKLFGFPAGEREAIGFALTLPGIAGILEFFGGILIAIGLLTRPASFAATFVLLVTVYVHGIVRGEGYSGAEKSILWAAIFFFFAIRGGNGHSVDAKLGKEF